LPVAQVAYLSRWLALLVSNNFGRRNAKCLQLLMNFSLILGYIKESKITNWSGILQQKQQQQNLPQS
jgi:hypothetical protein